jgi:hypothetical protein
VTATRPGIDDPDIKALLDAPAVPEGERGDTIPKILNAAGKSGWSNHQILAIGSELAGRWGCNCCPYGGL